MKIKTIKLSYPNVGREHSTYYSVLQITDSTEFDPRQLLEKAQVDELCASKHWKVIIVPAANGLG